MKRKKKNAFTLIELLAVIVILAIIALIATPIILGIVEDARKDAFLRSVELVVSTTDMDIATKPYENSYTYDITDGNISNLDIPVKNTHGMNGNIKYNFEGKNAYAIHNEKWCVIGEYNGESTIKDYDESCSFTDYLGKECLDLRRTTLGNYEITDKTQCQSMCPSLGVTDDATCTNLCNDEPMDILNGVSLTQYVSSLPESSQETFLTFQNPGLSPKRDGNEYEIVRYKCNSDKIIIPETIDGLKIVSILDGAFFNKKLLQVEIPKTIANIGIHAFADNQLTSIEIPEGITSISDYCFTNNKIENLIIPNSVTSVGAYAFANNELTNVEIPSSITSIDWYAFFDNQLTSVIIPEGITTIEQSTFANNKIKNLTLPESIIEIEYLAFDNNKLTNIELPENIASIGSKAFSNNQLTSIAIPTSATDIGYAAFNNNQLPDDQAFIYKRNSDGSIDNSTLMSYGGAKRENVIIPSNVTTIYREAFGNNALTSVTIPSSITEIGYHAFYGNQLTSVEIPNSVTKIDSGAFANNQLTSLSIPTSVTYIGLYAFNNNQLPDDQAFIYKRNSDGTVNNYKIIGYGGAKRENVVIPSTATAIDSWAFYESELKSITIPSSIGSIGEKAFANNQLTSVKIENGLKSIGEDAFQNNQLTSLIIPSTVTSIGYGSFNNNQLPDDQAFIYKRNNDGSIDNSNLICYGGAKRENVIIPSNVTSISEGAFRDNALVSVEIPNSVIEIGNSAFYNNQLTSITIPSSVMKLRGGVFEGNLLTSVTIKGKNSMNDFEVFGGNYNPFNFTWAPGYDDSYIVFEND